jgi:hypothetical protein
MSNISIKADSNGQLVRKYANNAEFGYIVLQSTEMKISGSWVGETVVSCLLKGKLNVLNAFSKLSPIPGRIWTYECLEDNVPPSIQKEHLRDDLPWEEALESASAVKTAGVGGPTLTLNGKRILRFTEYDISGQKQDVRLQHDNIAEVQAFAKLQKAKSGDADEPAFPG